MPAVIAYIGLGANLGQRRETLRDALRRIDELTDTHVLRCSSFLENPARGCAEPQPDFLNAVAELRTALPPADLLAGLQRIEEQLGRVRSTPNAPRTLDLDLLLYADLTLTLPGLVLPHPRMWQRDFVLGPLTELVGSQRVAVWRKNWQ
jgi:2-amino-4-hydroxy-6-hydroxymethyldihydropteridine diphosphokinase